MMTYIAIHRLFKVYSLNLLEGKLLRIGGGGVGGRGGAGLAPPATFCEKNDYRIHRRFIGVGEDRGGSAPELVVNEQGGSKVWTASHPSACDNLGRTT